MNASVPLRDYRRYSLSFCLSVLFSVVVFAAGAAVAWVGYLHGRDLAFKTADEVFLHIGLETKSSLAEIMQPARSFAELLALQPVQPIARAHTLSARLESLPLLMRGFAGNVSVDAIYCAYDDGGFFLLTPLRDATQRSAYSAPAGAAFMAESVEMAKGGRRNTHFLFFDEGLREIGRYNPRDFTYDPRERPWYRLATEPGKRVLTEPYRFAASGELGLTVAVRTNSSSVIGIDTTLRGASERLAALATLPGMKIALFDPQRRLLAQTGADRPPLQAEGGMPSLVTLDESGDPVLASLQSVETGEEAARTLDVGGRAWKETVLTLPGVRGPMYLGIAVPLYELLGQARTMRDHGLLAAAGVMLLALPVTWWTARRVAHTLRDITREAGDIHAFRFDGPGSGDSFILEVDQLSEAMTMMRGTIRRFLEIATSLAAETNFQRLLERVVFETSSASGAKGGLLYLSEDDGRKLVPASFVHIDGKTLDISASVRFADDDSLVAEAFRSGRTMLTRGGGKGLEFLHNVMPDEKIGMAAIPLRDRGGDTVGVLVLFSPVADVPNEARIAFVEALSKTAAIAIETQRLLEARKALLDAFIRLIAGAIDAKSPYTGGHCQRVPELTMMIAQAACDASKGPFKDFALSEAEREALQIASWLHDCGKVTTPEYVVDKATKLETLYDRIHEVRMRFEVLKRDAELDFWKAAAAGADADVLKAGLTEKLDRLDEEFAFVASCNEGGEVMDPARLERLKQIAARTWMRTLDDRIGISSDEKARKALNPTQPIPAVERLLDDRPDHRIPRADADRIADENAWGFHLEMPELKYNRGELHNLSIGRGTLTDEERYVINHHIVQTIIMLSQLPFPKHLAEVPDLAGGHHEKMDGSGYPRRLKREEMSVGARIMAIADIFEALTADDRPYKSGKPLSEAIRIMSFMKRDGHIDPDLFDLFLRSGVYRLYAERFLQPEQVDEVDIARYLGDSVTS